MKVSYNRPKKDDILLQGLAFSKISTLSVSNNLRTGFNSTDLFIIVSVKYNGYFIGYDFLGENILYELATLVPDFRKSLVR